MQNIVIIGAASGGAQTARNLEKNLTDTNYRIVLIDMLDNVFWPISSLRAAVKPGWEDKAMATTPISNFFGSKSRHIALGNTEAVSLAANEVTVKSTKALPEGLGELIGDNTYKIPFAYAAVATGSKYAFPARPASKDTTENKKALQRMQGEVKAAQHILIVGGGAVGVEFAGEVRAVHPEKKITLVHSTQKLIAAELSDGLHSSLAREMSKLKIDVILGQRVTTDLAQYEPGTLGETKTFTLTDGRTIEADFLLKATGNVPNTDLLKTLSPSLVSSKTGRMLVDQQLRLTDEHGVKNYPHVYALGDASESAGMKVSFAAGMQGDIVGANIISAIKKQDSKAKSWKGLPMTVCMVPLGSKGGAGQMGWFTVGGFVVSKIKGGSLFFDKFNSIYTAKA